MPARTERHVRAAAGKKVQKIIGLLLVGNKGDYMAQHEHTILVTGGKPVILTEMNGLFN